MRRSAFIIYFLLCDIVVKAQVITTIAGSGLAGPSLGGYTGDGGPATVALLYRPQGIAVDKSGNIYFTQTFPPCIRKIGLTRIVTTVVGTGISGYSGDGGPATAAQISSIGGIAFDKNDNLYVADEINQRIRRIDTNGIITTIAGTGIAGYSGDGGPATIAQLHAPIDVTVDSALNIYIVDESNHAIRKVSNTGIITTIAGNGVAGYSGDGGPATAAELNMPKGVAIDKYKNIYVADFFNNRIRKISTSGIISTVAGVGTVGYSGDGGQATIAQLYSPIGVSLDENGTIYVCEYTNSTIRKINSSGIITTITGNGIRGFGGDEGPATAAQVFIPVHTCMDAYGNIIFIDSWNNRIRKITYHVAGINEITNAAGNISIKPNPTRNGLFEVNIKAGNNEKAVITITNVTGEKIQELQARTNEPVMVKIDAPPGVYFIHATTAAGKWCERVIVE